MLLPKRNILLFILTAALFYSVQHTASAQTFGQNKVQYRHLQWKFIQTPHFDIYYTEGGLNIAEFTAKEAEKAYRFIADDFRWTLPEDGRISLITYESHNDFEQTNVMSGTVEEGIQGFTEFFKNRIVVPYQGSWEDYRHTIHHELTHAINMYMFYGSGVMSIIEGISRTRVPLWFTEGISEYESLFGMDTESEMFIRDLVVNSRLPELDQLDYYGFVGVYKCGQSVWQFIADTYGKEKIGELMHQVKNSRDLSRAVKTTLGLEWKEFNRRWQKFINRYHWPIGAQTEQPIDFADKITDHRQEEYNYYDISPAISPKGDMLVYISNRSDYFDVYLYSLIERKRVKKLLSGERSKSFEELHIIRPGISWSPDSKNIVLASKAGGYDALTIIDVDKAKVVRTYSFEMDGIYSPAWSTNADEIAFCGIVNGASDIYLLNLNNGKISQVTNDVFSDLEPAWSFDGNTLVFSSDRQDYLDMNYLPHDFDIYDFNYHNFDIYSASRQNNWKLSRLTSDESIERTPIFGSDSTIFYVSDANGIFNLYRCDLLYGQHYPITDVVTGILQPSISPQGDKLAFVSLYNFGYDIYLLSDPNEPSLKKQLKLTPLKEKLLAQSPRTIPNLYQEEYILPRDRSFDRPYKNFIFDFRRQETTEEGTPIVQDTTKFRTESGKYVENDYEVKFTADYVYANAYFSSIWGARGIAVAHFSDVMGDQNIILVTDLQNRVEVSNYLLGFQYLPRRIDIAFSLYHLIYYFYTSAPVYGSYNYDHILFRDRYYGAALSAHYPFSKFRRLEFNTDLVAIDRAEWDEFWDEFTLNEQRRLCVSELAYVKDNSVSRHFGPMNGGRFRLSFTASPNLYPNNFSISQKRGIDFYISEADYRRYFKAGFDHSFGLRFAGGASFGDNPARFFLGGVENWINRPYYIDLQESEIEDIYVSKFIFPLRGSSFYELQGTRYFLINSEFRFPFIQYFILGWPIPYPFIDIRGALFMDLGGAWTDEAKNFNLFKDYGDGSRLADALMGFGFGMRFPFPFIGWPTQWDVAWKSDLNSTSKPRYYLSIGYEF